jgi:hypothetical protein
MHFAYRRLARYLALAVLASGCPGGTGESFRAPETETGPLIRIVTIKTNSEKGIERGSFSFSPQGRTASSGVIGSHYFSEDRYFLTSIESNGFEVLFQHVVGSNSLTKTQDFACFIPFNKSFSTQAFGNVSVTGSWFIPFTNRAQLNAPSRLPVHELQKRLDKNKKGEF